MSIALKVFACSSTKQTLPKAPEALLQARPHHQAWPYAIWTARESEVEGTLRGMSGVGVANNSAQSSLPIDEFKKLWW